MKTVLQELNVNNFNFFLPHLLCYLQHRVENFKAGAIKNRLNIWESITSDPETLSTVSGLQVQFEEDFLPFTESSNTIITTFSDHEKAFIEVEVSKLLKKAVIEHSVHEENEFISPIFLVPKDGDSYRLILNLKKLNSHMPYVHFKMDTIQNVLSMIRPNIFMASIDIKDAYYSVPIYDSDQKYLKFKFDDKIYKFTCLPNGLCCGPRKFTKLLKSPLGYLREQDCILSACIDDIIVMDNSYDSCLSTAIKTVRLFDSLGFIIHPEKSSFIPSMTIRYLGFELDSVNMTVSLPQDKKLKIIQCYGKLLSCENPTIRSVASVLGLIVSSFPAVRYGPLHHRALNHVKDAGLRNSKGKFDAKVTLDVSAKNNLIWWIKNVESANNDIYRENPSLVLETDASLLGWGAVYEEETTHGLWSVEESKNHINVLELKAIKYALQSLVRTKNSHIKVLCDNTTAVHSINKMGTSHSIHCNNIVQEIWTWAIKNNNWLTVSHIP